MKQLEETLEVRRNHLGRLLFNLESHFRSMSIPYIQEHGFPEFTPAILSVVGHMHLSRSTPQAEIVARNVTSKQAISKLVDQCVQLNLVSVTASESDRRSRELSFTPKGLKLMQVAASAIQFAQGQIRDELGKKQYDALREALTKACTQLNLDGTD